MSDGMMWKIRRWNAGDVLLHDQFNRTFWDKVAKYGAGFESDLAEFRRLKQIATEKCVSKDTRDRRFYKIRLVSSNKTDDYCNYLLRYDADYTSMLKKKMSEVGLPQTTP